jgi:antibiotic biosynthesis monooxygenase (ABM) superfamily enzyme
MPTLVVKRHVMPGHEKEYEQSINNLIDQTEQMDGYMGINVARPASKKNPIYVFSARFDSKENLNKFKESEVRKECLKELQHISQEPIKEKTINKLDWWFALPSTQHDVPRYKMVSITVAAAYPIVLAFNFMSDPSQHVAILALRTFIIVIFTIIIMSYITLPFLLYMLKPWLQPHTD